MAITQIRIHHFRNITQADIRPSESFNFLIGDNGSGKTGFLEAIYMLGHGRAFRHLQSNRVIQHEQSELAVYGQIRVKGTTHTLGVAKARNGDNRFKINHDSSVKASALAQLLPIQLITPEGFDLLTGGPKYRRSFLDWGCFHHFPGFFDVWAQLRRLLKQRNALLRQLPTYDRLRPWDKELIAVAQKMDQYRHEYTDSILPELMATSRLFLPEYELDCHYYPGWDPQKAYEDTLAAHFERDKQLSYTAYGPHKADLRIKCRQIPAEDLLSRGQLKLLVCALRLAQGEFYTKQTDQPCLYLIDDFASELDAEKRLLLANRLKNTRAQVFITAITKDQITHMIDENDKIFYVKSGIITD